MKKLFFMALLMSSFSSYGSELSTLTTYINLAKGFSPAFYEDVMANLKTTKEVCENAPNQKKAIINELNSGGIATKDFIRKKEQLEQIPNSIIQSLDRQIRKLNEAQLSAYKAPKCISEYFGLHILGFNFLNGTPIINEQFVFAIDYLTEIKNKFTYIDWSGGYTSGDIGGEEKAAYQNCTIKLDKLLKGVKYE